MSALSHHVLALPGATLHLLPERAAWWPAARTLFIADAHFGKAAVFRARGLPVPEGTTADTLAELDGVMATRLPREVVFLGDFLHAREAHQPAVLDALDRWRTRHARITMRMVRGNHDAHAGDPPPSLGIDVVDEPLILEAPASPVSPASAAFSAAPVAPDDDCPPAATASPLVACHHPQHVAGASVLAGHLHPCAVLTGRGRDALRLPCFHYAPGLLVLPAFGAFTGGWVVPPSPGATRYAVGAGRVWRLPS